MKNIKNKFLFNSVFLLVIFILAVIVWYSPILFKGYSPNLVDSNINIARNINESGIFSLEDNLNIVLSSSLISEKGEISGLGNKFTAFLYAGLWKIFNSLSLNQLILISVIINAFALIIFTILVSNLFNWKTGLLFAIIYIFLPFNWKTSYSVGSYEFALIFIALFFLFYFQAQKEDIQKYAKLFWILAGIFLTGAILSRETFILIPPFLVLFLLWEKRKEALIFIMIPFVLLMSIFWLSDFVQRSNYLNLLTDFFKISVEKQTNADFSFYGDLYPDPYTYHFNKDVFLKENLEKYNQDAPSVEKIEKSKIMENVGAKKISLIERLKVSLIVGFRHVFRFFSLEDIGGPFVFLLLLIGFFHLRRKKLELGWFFVGWISFSIFLMTFIFLFTRSHLIDFNWAITLMITLGFFTVSHMISKYFKLGKKKIIYVQILFLGIIIYNFILANHVFLGRAYDDISVLQMESYSQSIKSLDINSKDVIALDVHGSSLYHLNYLTDKSLVIFRTSTIKDLMEKNKLESAFDEFNVKYIIGYPDDLSDIIIKQTEIINIASEPIELIMPNISRNKSWLMNLIK